MTCEDFGGLMFGVFDLGLEAFGTEKTSGRQRPLGGGVQIRSEDAFRKEDDFGEARCGGG